jgi:putative ABC transport system ATP-binding protein
MIRLENIVKKFKNKEIETLALNNVNFEVKDGEFVAIMGPSGCGKSTLLNLIGMIDTANQGKYYFNKIEVSKFSESKRSKLRRGTIGFVFQNFNLIEELTVYENIEMPLLYLNLSNHERAEKINQALVATKMAHKAKVFPQQLSGGQQQRVAIARAVVSNPKLILADEPTGNLDSSSGEEIMNLLTLMNQNGTTIIMVTHSLSDADKAERIIQLLDGHIISENLK